MRTNNTVPFIDLITMIGGLFSQLPCLRCKHLDYEFWGFDYDYCLDQPWHPCRRFPGVCKMEKCRHGMRRLVDDRIVALFKGETRKCLHFRVSDEFMRQTRATQAIVDPILLTFPLRKITWPNKRLKIYKITHPDWSWIAL